MRSTRKLTLKRETLTPLGTDDLAAVHGGSHVCRVTDRCTHGASIDEPCPTFPVAPCLSLDGGSGCPQTS